MALQELSPPPPITGYTALGNAVNQGSRDNMIRQLQLQDEERQRANQSTEADRASSRLLENQKAIEDYRNREAGIRVLINEGLLMESQRSDEVAIETARKAFAASARGKMYGELFNTPDENGQPLITREEAMDPAKVQAAENRLSQIKSKQANQTLGLANMELEAKKKGLIGGQAAANRSLQAETKLNERIDRLTNELNSPVPPVTEGEILNLARNLWLQNHPGEKMAPTDSAKLSAEIGQATQDLQTARYMAAKEERDLKNQEISILRQQLISGTMLNAKYASGNFYADETTPPPQSGLASISGQTQPLSAQSGSTRSFLERAAAIQDPSQASNPPPPSGQLIDNPTNNPTIAAGNAQLQSQQKKQLQSELNAAIVEGQQIEQQLQEASTGVRPGSRGIFQAPNLGGFGYDPSSIGQVEAAQITSNTLKAKAMNDAKIKALQAQLVGPVVATATPPAINTPTSFTSTPAFATPTGLLSQSQTPQWWQAGQGK